MPWTGSSVLQCQQYVCLAVAWVSSLLFHFYGSLMLHFLMLVNFPLAHTANGKKRERGEERRDGGSEQAGANQIPSRSVFILFKELAERNEESKQRTGWDGEIFSVLSQLLLLLQIEVSLSFLIICWGICQTVCRSLWHLCISLSLCAVFI